MKEVQIVIKKDGSVTVDVVGAVGSECQDITKPLIDRLGKAGKETLKDEFYATETINVQDKA